MLILFLVGKVNGPGNSALMKEHRVEKFPTMLLFGKTLPSRGKLYKGEHTKYEMVTWVKEQLASGQSSYLDDDEDD